ncbi:carbohydrate-binding module family 20 domain-containing protein [Winogradskya humida]|uniref:Alpha-amylase n=1 Tax=Winogradskya humida TaxID=113566 RepID=A0ABQ4A3X8_9ACTN|nr:carbohydrate-binding module family 20 domain-containing protein [Actinoplanes humidus]GIE25551.1 alpha-amylase [Actinoplanes humidus]
MKRRLRVVIARVSAVSLLAAGGVAAVVLTNQADAAVSLNDSDVTANLWEWNWPSIAKACTGDLGPAGYGAVQVAPPQESITLPTSVDGVHPWWEVYQPVSYAISSRLGTRAQFASMVTACHTAGVRVYADAVINHTAGHGNSYSTGYAGSKFTPGSFDYPAVPYTTTDFHHAGDGSCNDEDGQIDDWNNVAEVQNCELSSLSDLKTGSSGVRDKIAGYLNDLISLGVDGFRVDAAKHIAQADFAQIKSQLRTTTAEGRAPYVEQEVMPGGTGGLANSTFTPNGDLIGFSYARGLATQFRDGTLSNLSGIPSWSLDASSAQTGAMITNHDTERDGSTLRYQDGSAYTLANYFVLAYPYGKPFLYDGFTFSTSATGQSPPADANGFVSDTDCGNGKWQCITRSTGVKGMVAWHNAVAPVTTVSDFTATSGSVIGFHRGSLGWIGLNASGSASTASYPTGLADGTYCDRITGGATGSGCAGTSITVSGGKATVTIPAGGAVAIDTNAKSAGGSATTAPTATATAGPTASSCSSVAVSFAADVTTEWGQNVFVLGNQDALNNWGTSGGVALSSGTYPVWTGAVSLPKNTTVEYKYVKKDGATVTWESGENRTFNTGTACTKTLTDTWK